MRRRTVLGATALTTLVVAAGLLLGTPVGNLALAAAVMGDPIPAPSMRSGLRHPDAAVTWSDPGDEGWPTGHLRFSELPIAVTTNGGPSDELRTAAVSGSMTVVRDSATDLELVASLAFLEEHDATPGAADPTALAVSTAPFEVEQYPDARFVLTEPFQATTVDEAGFSDRQSREVTLVGDLTLHGRTARIRIPATVEQLDDDLVRLSGAIDVDLADYGVQFASDGSGSARSSRLGFDLVLARR